MYIGTSIACVLGTFVAMYIAVASPRGNRGNVPPPSKHGKFAKDGEQPRPQLAMRIDSSRKL